MHLCRGEYSSFIRLAQAQLCWRLIVVPLSTFHRLAEQIGDPKGELIFLFNIARCGSTLLTQVKYSTFHIPVPKKTKKETLSRCDESKYGSSRYLGQWLKPGLPWI